MQLHGYLHTSNPDEFGFSQDNHIHEHIKMDELNEAVEETNQHDNI